MYSGEEGKLALKRELRRRIYTRDGMWVPELGGGDIHDDAGFARAHAGEDGLDQSERAEEVGIELGVRGF
jgi:hypothetical protein